ncbi:hypothetical protein [Rhizobium halophytocola]|uniref:O-antigen ligase domain-containing protein n=1 Tax=Rhizobium halophytocola TaxID=735519 RepID=A0ABS4E5K9_9HYPH|nr:hypothetical protein [Rhizobium halophytocola]MBP1853189.1 hypothetical protein [Rhizobium halophytocola]
MNIEPIGFIVAQFGLLSLFLGMRWLIGGMIVSTLLGAAAAIQLPALGGASIQPSHLLLVFATLAIVLQPSLWQPFAASFRYRSPGFWFAAYILFSVLSAFFLPRIFQGATLVYSSARSATGTMSAIASPLAPGTANLTQSVYLLGDLVCFGLVCSFARLGHTRFVTRMLMATTCACLAFAVVDVSTFFMGMPDMLDFLRNANYTMHTAETISGFKRIVGSYPEASAYGTTALALFAFSATLWLEEYASPVAGPVTLLIGVTIVLCTSTTAYVAGALVLAMLLFIALKRLIGRRWNRRYSIFFATLAFVVPCLCLGIMLLPHVWGALYDLVSMTLLDKADSQSGEERTAWNALALISFLETDTFGAGLGTVRASSFPVALLSNVGIIGTLLFLIFLFQLIRVVQNARAGHGLRNNESALAALMASLSLIASASISGSSTDLSLLFSVTAGLVAGATQTHKVAAARPVAAVQIPTPLPAFLRSARGLAP